MDNQLNFLYPHREKNDSCYCMSLEEMFKHEWSVFWSGGKDSTTTIIKMHELGIRIKYIVYVLMMYDTDVPATLPMMREFVDRAIETFREWGYEVLIQKSERTAKQYAEDVFTKSKKGLNGCTYGMRSFIGGVQVSSRKRESYICTPS